MFKIKLFGEIGWDIYSFEVVEMLKEANGQDVDVIFNTPGGFTVDGNIIDDAFLQYKKDFPNAQMMATIIEAQSYGSYLLTNPAFDMVVARTNSIVMIHNPLMGVVGDYKKLKKNADILERQAVMFAERYAVKMKKASSEIRSMMDEETYFIGGQEIVDSGIADDIVSDSDVMKDKMSLRASAETRLDVLKIKIRNNKEDFEKIVAMSKEQSTQTAQGGENNLEDQVENEKELLEKFPKVHSATMKAGEDKGKEEVKANIEALVKMKQEDHYKNIPEVLAVIDESIVKMRTPEETHPLIMATLTTIMSDPKKAALMKANADSVGDINTVKTDDTVSGEPSTEFDDEERF